MTGITQDIIAAAAREMQAKVLFNSAGKSMKEAVDFLGNKIAIESDCVLLSAPVKGRVRAAQKVADKYGGDWLKLGDVARITIAASNEFRYDKAVATVLKYAKHEHGLFLKKNETKKAVTDPYGYSDTNIVVRFVSPQQMRAATTGSVTQRMSSEIWSAAATPALRRKFAVQPAPFKSVSSSMSEAQIRAAIGSHSNDLYMERMVEIQVNTMEMLYAKMTEEVFVGIAGLGPVMYRNFRLKFGIEGGYGHLLLEACRGVLPPDAVQRSKELSIRYYNRARGLNPRPAGKDPLEADILAFLKEFPPPAH